MKGPILCYCAARDSVHEFDSPEDLIQSNRKVFLAGEHTPPPPEYYAPVAVDDTSMRSLLDAREQATKLSQEEHHG